MRDLIELTGSLPWSKLKSTPVWDTVLEPGSKMSRLFDLAWQKQVVSDEEASEALYGSTTAISKLHSLKNKLKERLLDAVFLLDYNEPAYTDRQKAHFECNKKWATAMTLLSKKVHHSGIELLEHLLRRTRHFEFTELSMNALYYLRLHYGTIAGDLKKYEHYRDLYRQYQAIWMMENEAEEGYTNFISQCVVGRVSQEDAAEQAESCYGKIEPYLTQCDSFRLHLSGRLLQVQAHSSRGNHRKVADLCEEAIRFFKAKPYDSPLPLQAFYYQLVVSCVQLRDFGRGQAVIRQHHNIYEEGTFNWFKVQELYFLLALHTQHYDDAFDTCERVSRHAGLEKQPAQIREMWKVYEAYAHLLVRARRTDRLPARPFRRGKFLNEIPEFSKDKRGMNIPVLIVQLLFDIADKRHDACIERVEALEKYASRYLKKQDHFRSNCFLKMILQLPEAAFHREAAVRKTERFLTLLKETPLEIANQPHEIEIIPYEDLWDITLDLLKAPGK